MRKNRSNGTFIRNIIAMLFICLLALTGCQQFEMFSNSKEGSDELKNVEISISSTEFIEESTLETESEAEKVFEWAFDAPENHQMNGSTLQAMHDALTTTEIHSVVTVKDGVIIDVYYKEGYDENSVFPLHSVSKSFTSALIGIAIDEGLIPGVDVLISEYFPQINDSNNEYLKQVTIRHLLTHTSGIEWYEWNGRSDSFYEWRDSDNWVDYVLSRPFTSQPGTTFTYTTGGTHLLAAILEKVSGQSVTDYATEHLFAPMRMESVEWGEDPQGIADGGNGLIMTARDASKFGQLFLQNGSWEGDSLVSESWVKESTSIQVSRGRDSGDYGYQWWIRPFGGYDTYFAMGAWGQFIFVVPELNIVTTTTSTIPENTYFPWPYFTDYVVGAYEGE